MIEKHANPREVYNQKLIDNGSIDADLAKEMEKKFWSDLQERLDDIKAKSHCHIPIKNLNYGGRIYEEPQKMILKSLL